MNSQLAQARQRNRRRWIVRIGVALLVLLLVGFLGVFVAMRSGMSPEEADKAYQQLSQQPTREEVLRLFGKPVVDRIANDERIMLWYFCSQSLWSSEVFRVMVYWKKGEFRIKQGRYISYSGWESWQWQWQLFIMRLKR